MRLYVPSTQNWKGLISIDARTLQILMDINSLQSFGAVQTFSEQNTSSPSTSLFTTMLDEMLEDSSPSGSLLGTMSTPGSLPGNIKPTTFPTALSQSTNLSMNKINAATSSSGKYEDIIKGAAEQYNIPERLISSVIQHESNFNSDSVSHAGAQGLMQLMPGTAKFLGVKDSFDPAQNIKGGASYLRQMLNQFNGNIEHALAAYNAGPGNVSKYGGIPPFKETQNYVQKVLNTYNA